MRVGKWTQAIRSSLWFVPMIIVLGAMALAIGMLYLDTKVSDEVLAKFPRLFGAGADSERAMLAAIATSMITVAGVTFSITMVAVAQSASQYTPRVLGNFMRDRGNQMVLGVFVGVFAYCLVVIRTIRGDEDIRFVPSVSVVLAFVLALVAMGFLIYFIHHIAGSLQASTLLHRVRIDTERAVDILFPEELGGEAEADDLAVAGEYQWAPVASPDTGYVQRVDDAALLKAARKAHAIVRMDRGIGEFVVAGEALISVRDSKRVSEEEAAAMAKAFMIGSNRTIDQDAVFGIRQMVDVAMKALSPAENSTTTAIRSLDHISAVLCRLAPRRLQSEVRADEESDEPRVIARGPSFRSLVNTGFDEIRRSAAGNVNILERMLAVIERVASFTEASDRRAVLAEHVDRIEEVARRTVPADEERLGIEQRCQEVRRVLEA